MRKKHPGVLPVPRQHQQSDNVDYFFLEMYQSAAEPLPVATKARDAETALGQLDLDEMDPWLVELSDQQDHAGVLACEEDWDPDRPPVSDAALTVHARDSVVVGLPVRWLNHSNLTELYWVFLATWEVQTGPEGTPATVAAPSRKTFSRRYGEVWKQYLRFRKVSQHTQCNTCFRLQACMGGRGKTEEERLSAAAQLRRHLRDQYLDRCIYWSLRWASRQHDLGVLTVIIDSMDKTKFAWPRLDLKRLPKELEHLQRPRLVLTAALAHGYSTNLFWANETVTHGADAFIEVLMRTVESVWQACRCAGKKFPRHLVVLSDNTVAQAKNSAVTSFLAWMVGSRKFATTNLLFLRVGHTHEDIGLLFLKCE